MAAQSTQILDFLTARALGDRDAKGEARYLLTGITALRSLSPRHRDFYTYHGYLSILVANVPEQSEALNDIRKGLER